MEKFEIFMIGLLVGVFLYGLLACLTLEQIEQLPQNYYEYIMGPCCPKNSVCSDTYYDWKTDECVFTLTNTRKPADVYRKKYYG